MAARFLIVNADDLGLSEAVNAGVVAAHAGGIVTSASLMVNGEAAAGAAEVAGRHPALAVGLHLDLGQWDYVDGEWRASYQRCLPDDADAVEREGRAQLDAFRGLMGRDPTHLDSHQHVHTSEPVASVAARLAAELAVPLRGRGVHYEGGFYGQSGKGAPYPEGISVERLTGLIDSLPSGWTELGCHPGIGVTREESSYASEREREVEALRDPRVQEALERSGVRLRSFAELGRG
jgi:chitin disaccharide deacetylase